MTARVSRSREPGWLQTAGGALLLVVVGFAVGLIAGTAFEQPDLVIDQLAGRGERVAVEEVDVEADARIPAVSTRAREVTEPAPLEEAVPPGPVEAGPPARSGPGFAIQVGAFGERGAARGLVERLRGDGLPGYVAEGAGSPWRVRVGPYPSEAEARRVAGRLRSEHELPTWVLRVEGS